MYNNPKNDIVTENIGNILEKNCYRFNYHTRYKQFKALWDMYHAIGNLKKEHTYEELVYRLKIETKWWLRELSDNCLDINSKKLNRIGNVLHENSESLDEYLYAFEFTVLPEIINNWYYIQDYYD